MWLVVSSVAACGSTVDGVATCPGCGSGTEPEFPTRTVEPSTPTTSPGPTVTRAMPPTGEVLPPNSSGYVYIETQSGKTRCQISAETVGCESDFANPPIVGGEPAYGVEVSAGGSSRWVVGNLGAMPTTTLEYHVYNAVGWTIEAERSGTRFTNDATGHGMSVSTDSVEFF
ncbi:MAG: hypothetical protein KDB71_05175 [Mycobacterium sp.]|nr:hypothetical protein [Mycobacterium sp.]